MASIELHVPNFKQAIEFYSLLGFSHKFNDSKYVILTKDTNTIYLYNGTQDVYNHSYFKQFDKNTKKGYAVEIIIEVENIEELYNQVKDKVKIVTQLQKKPWGKTDFRVEDPFGFYLRITSHTHEASI